MDTKIPIRGSIGGKLQRKPLSDRTNTVSRSSQQSSSSSATTLVKFSNPNLTSSLNRLVDQASLKESSVDVDKPEDSDGSASLSVATTVKPVPRRISSDLSFPAPNKPRSSHGVSDKKVDDPCEVYTVRRKASCVKRSNKASSSGALACLRLDLVSSTGYETHSTIYGCSILRKLGSYRHRRVKQEGGNLVHGATQDYIEQQRAYYAEVDAFELSEEEVSYDCYLD
ncbi:unnamed protein product [Cochlearia groenlandica]